MNEEYFRVLYDAVTERPNNYAVEAEKNETFDALIEEIAECDNKDEIERLVDKLDYASGIEGFILGFKVAQGMFSSD